MVVKSDVSQISSKGKSSDLDKLVTDFPFYGMEFYVGAKKSSIKSVKEAKSWKSCVMRGCFEGLIFYSMYVYFQC